MLTGCRAAVAGGFSDVAMMPNTQPALDEASRVRGICEKADYYGLARVQVIAACTLGLEGEALTELVALQEAGAIGFSDDGRPVWDSGRMRRVREWARIVGLPVVTHAEDLSLRGQGVMHEGEGLGPLGSGRHAVGGRDVRTGARHRSRRAHRSQAARRARQFGALVELVRQARTADCR